MVRKKNKTKSSMTQISITLPNSLLKQIDELAKLDNRNRSNFIANSLATIAEEKLGGSNG